MLEQRSQDKQRIADRARYDLPVQLRELIADQRVVRDSTFRTKVFRVEPSMNCFHWHHETNAIGTGNFTAAPALRDRKARMILDQLHVRLRDCVGLNVMPFRPCQSRERQRRVTFIGHRCQTNVARLGEQYGQHAQFDTVRVWRL